MSNKTRLQTNNTNLQALINKANALPDAGGSGGGGSVETCTLIVTSPACPTSKTLGMAVDTYKNNIFESTLYQWRLAETFTIEDVICGSIIALCLPFSPLCNLKAAAIVVSYNAQQTMFIRIDAPAGGTSEIIIQED